MEEGKRLGRMKNVRGSIPGWAASSFTLVSEWKKPIRYNEKVWPFSNWHGAVMVKAVVYEAQAGEDRFPARPSALLSWFQSGRKRINKL